MRLHPEAPLSEASLAAVAEAYGLGEPRTSEFIARGAMGAVHRITTDMHGSERVWAVKRAYWSHYAEDAIRREVAFTTRCTVAGVPAPRSARRIDDGGFVLTVDDQPDEGSQYRVLTWADGEPGDRDDDRTIFPLMEWMARIHNLGLEAGSQQIDDWFVTVKYDWEALIGQLQHSGSEIADSMSARKTDLRQLTDFVNSTRPAGAVWCHTDLGADNLIWGEDGPQLIDWENSGPLVPYQELGSFLRSLGSQERSNTAYRTYRRAGGPAEITELSHLASSVSVHLNYLGCQSELLLDAAHPEQHEFAREQASNAARNLPTIAQLTDMIDGLNSTK